MQTSQLFKSIPKVDELLNSQEFAEISVPHKLLVNSIRIVLNEIRQNIANGSLAALPPREEIISSVFRTIKKTDKSGLRSVINGTGVVLHTNFGRAPLSKAAIEAVNEAASSYSSLEYDLLEGKRGSRYSHVEPLLQELTGAESAIVVNNNAAAVLLILSALGKGREAVVSRGELVEIGGSFRVPDIMESCGCILKEVGTTNKTHLRDYENAINDNTFALMKVHTSNFRVIGFTESVSLDKLAELAHEKGLPLIEDLGSGAMYPPEKYGIHDEPNVAASIKCGVDIMCFSGDKLLGGPQAGIIVGRKIYLDIIKKHPLLRAMRVDKMTLAALEATLRTYLYGNPESDIPIISMLCASSQQLKDKAVCLLEMLGEYGVSAEVIELRGQVGGGSAPATELDGWGLAINSTLSPDTIEGRLRMADQAIVGRIINDRFCLDVRTIFDCEMKPVAETLAEVLA
ncbi:MAG: L-seryl-tRNA(Sec) selenium transferase [Oscillospiraceae bacterium]|nr:L-seryl-tRNA(Sec) selenium transferase [Oscillospiraceae bacterium]